MKKLILLFAAIMMANTGLWAETVKYIDADGQEKTVDATVVTDADSPVTWGVAGTTTWYVVTNANVTLSQGVICAGNVHLILADGAKLTATGWHEVDFVLAVERILSSYAGIQVADSNHSLTIYGQAAQSGKLEANGGQWAAGIGGGYVRNAGNNAINGYNITINGGMVTATGGEGAAGIGGGCYASGSNITINGGTVMATDGGGAAGIGGGDYGSGSNITINGGVVTANGSAAGIGGGYNGSGSNIKVATTLLVKADGNNPPTTEIDNDGGDIAGKLAGKPHAKIVSILPFCDAAIAAIDAAFEGITNEKIKAIATTAKTNIQSATTISGINSIKEKALADLQYALTIYNDGKADGNASAFGTLGTKQNGPAVIVTDKDGKEVILYSPKSVEYIKVKE